MTDPLQHDAPQQEATPVLRPWSKPTVVEEDYTITATGTSNPAHTSDGIMTYS